MKRVGLLLALVGLALAALPAPVAAAGPDCTYDEVLLYTHYYQSGLQGFDCSGGLLVQDSDSNFGDSSDAFRTVDNNDTDSWQVWIRDTNNAHCLFFYDGTGFSGSVYRITIFAGTSHAWGNLPSSFINRASSYTLTPFAAGTDCG